MAIRIEEDLRTFRNEHANLKIGCTFSCWDLLHAGHNLFLKDCKENCDILCVGLQTDPTLDRPEKNKPIQSLEEREIQVQSCRYVNYYFIYSTEETLYNSIVALKPDIRFLGNDYVGKKYTGDDLPVPIYYHARTTHNYSTTNLRRTIYQRESTSSTQKFKSGVINTNEKYFFIT